MPTLTAREKRLLGPLILPYQESSKSEEQQQPKDGESDRSAFVEFIHNAEKNGRPTRQYVELTLEEIRKVMKGERLPHKCFIWIIDETSIRLIREKTRNPARQ